jgi:hypothetical protein
MNTMLNDDIKNLFTKGRECIINTDLDGLLSGMLLQEFLDWKIVGYSSCCGKSNDELWLKDKSENIRDCVFVDLPVCVKEISSIDQHFVLYDKTSINKINCNQNKINPNIMRHRMLKNGMGNNEYTLKYPFGTVHFILAILENLNLLPDFAHLDFRKKLNNFDLIDLILRADRVIGNFCSYTKNCIDWANWIMKIGRENTKILFNTAIKEYSLRERAEHAVEKKLKDLGCIGIDGDCSNMFRTRDEYNLKNYLKYLSNATDLHPLPIFRYHDFGNLSGKRVQINGYDFNIFKKEIEDPNLFSYAFVSMRTLSLTYMEALK